MPSPYAQNAYKNNNVNALSQGEAVARLLETAAKHIHRAKDFALKDEFETRFQATEDAMKIITGLQGCLNYDDPAAAQMSDVLNNFYMSITGYITKINIHNETHVCDVVIESLREMAGTWRQVEKIAKEQAQAVQGNVASRPAQNAMPSGGIDIAAC